MKTPDSDLRAYFQTLTGLGASIFDRVSEQQAFPYIHLSDIRCDNFDTATEDLYDCEVLFDIVTGFDTKTGGRKQADTISEALLDAVSDNLVQIGDFQIVRCRLLTTNYLDEQSDSTMIIRKLCRVQFIVEQIN